MAVLHTARREFDSLTGDMWKVEVRQADGTWLVVYEIADQNLAMSRYNAERAQGNTARIRKPSA